MMKQLKPVVFRQNILLKCQRVCAQCNLLIETLKEEVESVFLEKK